MRTPTGEPAPQNGYHAGHVALLLASYRALLGRDLLPTGGDTVETARLAFEAPFFLASHDTEADPVLNYGNRTALDLFEMSWEQFTAIPSRLTAEAPLQEERAWLLEAVSRQGFIEDYSGIRISRSGRRFRIARATVWNVFGPTDEVVGQAATFSEWEEVEAE